MSTPIWDNSGYKRFRRNLERLGSPQTVPFAELFPPAFVAKYSRFPTIRALLDASGYRLETPQDFEAVPDAEWDAFISENTRFGGWNDMQHAALKEWAAAQLRA